MNELILSNDKFEFPDISNFDPNYISDLKHFKKWIADNRIDDWCNSEVVNKYLDFCISKFKVSTVNRRRVSIKKMISKMLGDQRYNPMHKALLDIKFKEEVNIYKVQNEGISTDQYLTKEEVYEIINKCDTIKNRKSSSGIRLKLMLKFMFWTGVRVSEMCGVLLKNCTRYLNRDDNNYYYKIWILGKGKKSRNIEIPEILYNDIIKLFEPKEYLFETGKHTQYDRTFIWRLVSKYSEEILGKKVHPHTLRHSFAMHQLNVKSNPVDAISRLLGHSTSAITNDTYLHNRLSGSNLIDSDF